MLNKSTNLDKYLFAYFLSEDDTHVRLVVSDDGNNFEALNSNQNYVTIAPFDNVYDYR